MFADAQRFGPQSSKSFHPDLTKYYTLNNLICRAKHYIIAYSAADLVYSGGN